MTLNEYIAENGDKNIEIREDGTVWILEEEGTWKPENGERYCCISGSGQERTSPWGDDSVDNGRWDIGNVFRTEAEAKRALHRLKARKKFLDAGGHEGIDGYCELRKNTHKPMLGVFLQIDGTLVVRELKGISAFMTWFESKDDAKKAIDSLTEDEVKALCRTGDEQSVTHD